MLYACAARFDVTGNLEKFCELNKALVASGCSGNGGMGMETDRKQQQPHVLRTSSRFQNQDHPDRKRRVSRMHMV